MPQVRIYFNTAVRTSVEKIKKQISANQELFAKVKKDQIVNPGFYKKVLEKIDGDYYISDYFEIEEKNIPSLQTELAYFKYKDTAIEKKTRILHTLIKIIYNPKKKIICFYSRAHISNEISERLIRVLNTKSYFDFIYKPMLYIYREDNLNKLVNALQIKNFNLITVWDYDNRLTMRNPNKISETEKYLELIEEQHSGNWTHLKVPFDDLNLVLKLSKTTKRFITFDNDYVDDPHLVKAIDFLTNNIFKIEDFSDKQRLINSFY